jgi:hypothetical protein
MRFFEVGKNGSDICTKKTPETPEKHSLPYRNGTMKSWTDYQKTSIRCRQSYEGNVAFIGRTRTIRMSSVVARLSS